MDKRNRKDSVVSHQEKKENMKNNLTEELTKTKMQLKEKEEEIMKLKIDKRDTMNMMVNNFLFDNIMSEIRKASMFMDMISKEELMSFTEEYEDKVDPKIKNVIKKSALSDITTSMYSCKCSSCLMTRVNSFDMKYIATKKITKHVTLTRGTLVSLCFNPRVFNFENLMTVDNKKMMSLILRDDIKERIEMTFTMAKSKVMKVEELDFGVLKNIDVKTNGNQVSLSSLIVVESMRTLLSLNKDREISILDETTIKEGINDCFYNTMKNFIPGLQKRDMLMSVNDLTIEEEMIMLTNSENNFVYIRKNQRNSKKNHISMEEFQDSTQISLKLMVTPMLRDVMFFAEVEDMEDEVIMKLNRDSSEDTSSERRVFPVVKTYPSSNRVVKSEVRMYDIMMTIKGNFNKTLIKESLIKKDVSVNSVELYSKSELFYFVEYGNVNQFNLIKLYHMSLTEFKGIAYFFESNKVFVEEMLLGKLNSWVEMYSKLNKMICFLYWKNKPMESRDIISQINDFNASLEKMSDMNSNYMIRLYECFKMRIINYFRMYTVSRQMDMHRLDNREVCMTLVDKTETFTDSEMYRLNMIKNLMEYQEMKISKRNNFPSEFNHLYKNMTSEFPPFDCMFMERNINIINDNHTISTELEEILM